MIEVTQCPFCSSIERTEIQAQNDTDKYLDLINTQLQNKEIRKGGGARFWYKCDNCEILYRSPKLNQKEQEVLYEKYRDILFRSETPDEYFDRITQYSDNQSKNFHKITWFLDNLNTTFINKSLQVLDVGCGGGVLLRKMKDMLPKSITYGVEGNKLYSNLARKRSGAIEIKTSYFHKKLFKQKFDIIVSCDVLEHVDCPSLFLDDIYFSLEKEGILFLEIPSPTNFEKLQYDHDIFRVPHHVFYTDYILRKYLKNSGFDNIKIENVKNCSNIWKLRAIANKAKKTAVKNII